MRSIWNGAISFGLVSIPIKLNATESHSVSFRQIHTEDGGRIRYRKVCELEDREVTQAEIGKAYEDADGSMIPITDEDLLPIPTARTIEIVAFVPEDRIDPLQMGSAYYLAASGAPAAKPYTLLREALKRSNRVAIAKFALRGRERLGMLRVVGDAIAMHGLLWPDEVRAPEGVAPEADVTVRDQELDLADALMDTLGEIDLDDLHDEYREAVEEVVAAKAAGQRPPEVREEAAPGKVLDLMAALESSVRAARESRDGEGAGPAEEAEVRSLPQRKTSSRRAPKETGGKKSTSTAKKTAAVEGAAEEVDREVGGVCGVREEDGGQEYRQEGHGEERRQERRQDHGQEHRQQVRLLPQAQRLTSAVPLTPAGGVDARPGLQLTVQGDADDRGIADGAGSKTAGLAAGDFAGETEAGASEAGVGTAGSPPGAARWSSRPVRRPGWPDRWTAATTRSGRGRRRWPRRPPGRSAAAGPGRPARASAVRPTLLLPAPRLADGAATAARVTGVTRVIRGGLRRSPSGDPVACGGFPGAEARMARSSSSRQPPDVLGHVRHAVRPARCVRAARSRSGQRPRSCPPVVGPGRTRAGGGVGPPTTGSGAGWSWPGGLRRPPPSENVRDRSGSFPAPPVVTGS
ncbi:Non-homologous end joining protein Ku [Streptomyces violaceorubidus]